MSTSAERIEALNAGIVLPSPEVVPPELRALRQWVGWRYEWRSKPTKPPINPHINGELRHARTNDPTTWADFDTTLAAARAHGLGIGFCFRENDGLAGIDLDHVLNPDTGEIDPKAAEIIERFKATYCETSPSGTGIRIFCRGKPQRSGKNAGTPKWLEGYAHPSSRYLTVTGRHWPGTATQITEQQAGLDWLHETYMTSTGGQDKPPPVGNISSSPALDLDDAALLVKARGARNGAEFERLFAGDVSRYQGDHSSADLALCSLLAFWTDRDATRMDRLFRSAGLMRPKWDERRGETTYGAMTIEKAIASTRDTYSARNGRSEKAQEARSSTGANGGTPPDTLDGWTPGEPPAQDPETAQEAGTAPGPSGRLPLDGEDSALLAELAALSPIEYDRRREAAAETLGIRVSTLDAEVTRLRQDDATPEAGGKPVTFAEPELWPDLVDGAALLGDLRSTIRRYLILPSGADTVAALWTLHAWTHDAFRVSPILCITSPDKRCGKSTLLILVSALAPRALPVSSITASALFRAVELWRPTLLIDEADTFLRDNEELRGVINSGHTREGAYVIRTVGDDHEPRRFGTWSPKAIALIGRMAPTLMDRAIIISMRRKRPDEQVARLRLDQLEVFGPLVRKCARWARDNHARLREIDPDMPAGMNDRAADNWRPLLAIAEAVGEEWPSLAREIIKSLSGEDEDEAAAVLLLADIRALFEQTGKPQLPSVDIAMSLISMEERPWPEWHQGKAMTTRQIAKLLKPFGIHPKNIRVANTIPKGYELSQFTDAFSRYLPPVLSATPLQVNNDAASGGKAIRYSRENVADEKTRKPAPDKECSAVADKSPPAKERKVTEPDDSDPEEVF